MATAIQTAMTAFDEETDNYKAIILMTDGEDHQEGALEAASGGKWFLHLDEGCQYPCYPLSKQSGTFAQVGVILQADSAVH